MATDGDDTNPAGGTLSANVTEGYDGDSIMLSAVPARGYVFERYESFKANGASTDGLMPITNNMFTLDSKLGSVTVVAHFKTRESGRFELFYDDFISGAFDSSYIIKDTDSVKCEKGEVILDAAEEPNYLFLNSNIFQGLKTGEGCRISLDIGKAEETSGTIRLMFKGTEKFSAMIQQMTGMAAVMRLE